MTPETKATPPPPLTHTSVSGAALARRPAVEKEIQAALAQPPSAWTNLAKRDSALSGEALVHLARHLVANAGARSERDLLGNLLLTLDGRVTRMVQRFAQGFDEVTMEEIAIDVGRTVLELVLAKEPTRASDFLEVSFLDAVKHWALNAVQNRRRMPRRAAIAAATQPWAPPDDPRRAREDEAAAPIEAGDDGDSDPEAIAIAAERQRAAGKIREGLHAITDPKHREAVVLHHLEGWPIFDMDPAVPTVLTHFGVTSRQVRRWITTALAEMRASIGEES